MENSRHARSGSGVYIVNTLYVQKSGCVGSNLAAFVVGRPKAVAGAEGDAGIVRRGFAGLAVWCVPVPREECPDMPEQAVDAGTEQDEQGKGDGAAFALDHHGVAQGADVEDEEIFQCGWGTGRGFTHEFGIDWGMGG